MNSPAWHIVCVPDSFKGSLTSPQVAHAMAKGVNQACGREAKISLLPFADGGEGTLEVLMSTWGGQYRRVETVDAIGRPITAEFGLSPDGTTAVIEAAQANGLPQVSDVPLQPLRANSFGVGVLLNHVLDSGVEDIIVCLGGSASTDGGTGIMSALGAQFFDEDDQLLPAHDVRLNQIARLDLSAVHPRARDVTWKIATDVLNPLCGKTGAAEVFAPQKGATPAEIRVLDDGLHQWCDVVLSTLAAEQREQVTASPKTRKNMVTTPGFGAAGGIAMPLVTILGAELVSGAELVAEALNLQEILGQADVIFTGEGSLDQQSLHGKVLSVVQKYAPEQALVISIAGSIHLTSAQCRAAGLTAAFSIAPGVSDLDTLVSNASDLIQETVAHVCSILSWAQEHSPRRPLKGL